MAKQKNDGVTRRSVLAGLGASVGSAVWGCGSGEDNTASGAAGNAGASTGGGAGMGTGGSGATGGVGGSGATGGAGASGGSAGQDGGAGTGGSAGQSGAAGQAGAGGQDAGSPSCTDNGNLTGAQLLSQIDHIVVLCMENRSFDHYLGSLKFIEGRMLDGLVGTETNPAPNGMPVAVHKLNDYTPEDPPHGWDACHAQFNLGMNDGFVKEHAGSSQNDVMGYHVRDQIPITYALADGGAVCDRYFCSVMGPTWPNRFYLHGASSNGQKSNLPVPGFQNVFALLNNAGISNKNYFHDVAWAVGGYFKLSGNAGMSQFFQDCKNGTLPAFSIIDPQFIGAGANDDHPDHDIQLGQALISTVVSALGNSPLWNKTLFVLTYDEHGGFYDHVPPPSMTDSRAEFRQLGFRVPSILIGPHVRKGCVVNTQFDHSSVIKTLVTRFGIPSLNARVDDANDFSSAIDPYYVQNPQPAPALPMLQISRSRLLSRARRGGEHPELRALSGLPRHLDRRSEGIGESEHVLQWGQQFGNLRVVR